MPECIIDDCDNDAKYGNNIDWKRIYCKDHKDTIENPVNISKKSLYCNNCYETRSIIRSI